MSMISNFRESTLTAYTDADQEEWDQITDVEFEKTNEIEFCTPKGNKVLFQKVRHGHWEHIPNTPEWRCSICGYRISGFIERNGFTPMGCNVNYCSRCGALMDEVTE